MGLIFGRRKKTHAICARAFRHSPTVTQIRECRAMETVQVRRRCFVRQAKTTQAKCLSASCFGAVWQNRCKQMCRLSLCGISFRQPYLSSREEGFAWRDLLVPARAAWRLPSKFGRSPTNRERLFSISDLSQFHYTTVSEFVKI